MGALTALIGRFEAIRKGIVPIIIFLKKVSCVHFARRPLGRSIADDTELVGVLHMALDGQGVNLCLCEGEYALGKCIHVYAVVGALRFEGNE